MYKGSMSEIARPQSELNPSEHSLQKEEPLRRASPRSQHPAANAVSLTSHKTQLLRLMVEVKLEAIGFRGAEVTAFFQRSIWVLSEVQEMQINQLNTIAFLMVECFLLQKVDESQNATFRNRVQLGRPILNMRSQYRNPSLHGFSQRQQEQNRAEVERHHRHPLSVTVERMTNAMERVQVEQIQHIPAASDRTILCSICCSPSFQFCEQPCSHTFCDSCLKGYIREMISSGTFSINCPQYNCPHFISKETIKKLLKTSQYQRFAYFKDKNQKEMNPQNKFCSRPDCGEVLQKKEQSMVCPKCEEKYCEVCLQREHRGQECDVALKAAMEHTYTLYKIKKCPNCKAPIQKESGCNHMTCKKCKHQFCWLCLKEYSIVHFKYYNCCGCPGMMFEDEQSYSFERVKQICLFLLLPIILVLLLGLYLLSVPLFMVGCLFLKPFEWIGKDSEMWEKDVAKCIFDCQGFCEIVYYVVAWILLQPRAILYAIFMAPIQITMICCRMAGRPFE